MHFRFTAMSVFASRRVIIDCLFSYFFPRVIHSAIKTFYKIPKPLQILSSKPTLRKRWIDILKTLLVIKPRNCALHAFAQKKTATDRWIFSTNQLFISCDGYIWQSVLCKILWIPRQSIPIKSLQIKIPFLIVTPVGHPATSVSESSRLRSWSS